MLSSEQLIETKKRMLRTSLQLKRTRAKLRWQEHMSGSSSTGRSLSQVAVLCLALLLPLGACHYVQDPKPMGLYRGMTDGAPAGTETFRYGWKSGCESGLSALGPLQYKATHQFDYDAQMLDNNEYHNAWRLGFRYCRWYTSQWTRFD